MGKVKFKHESGLCPYFLHKDKYFFINQIKAGDGWEYQLEVKDTWVKYKSVKSRKSINANSLVRRFLKNKKYTVESAGSYKFNVYFLNGILLGANDYEEKITIRPLPIQLSKTFKRQQECIKFAEKYIAENYMDQQVSFQA